MTGLQGEPRDHHPAWWYGDVPVPLHARVLSGLYGVISGVRRRLYRVGLLRRRHPGVPVVVVGNITAGGAGKTRLYFVRNKQYIIFCAKLPHAFEITFVRHHYTSFALDRLHHKCGGIRIFYSVFERF